MNDCSEFVRPTRAADLAIEQLAAQLLEARERTASVEADRDAYKVISSVLLDTIALMKSNPAQASSRERYALAHAREVVLRGLSSDVCLRRHD